MLKNDYTLVIYLVIVELIRHKKQNIGIRPVMYSTEHVAAQIKHKAT